MSGQIKTTEKKEEAKPAEHEAKKEEETKEPKKGGMPRRAIYALVAVVAVVIVAVAYVGLVAAQGSVVQTGDNVSVYYTGTLTNGTVFGTNQGQTPMTFIAGSNEVIPGFSDAVIGMHLNQTKTVTLPVNEAYGPVNPALIVKVPLTAFGNSTVQQGERVTSSNNGQYAVGIVIAVNATDATVNFNPPLAGQTLIFKITVIKIAKG